MGTAPALLTEKDSRSCPFKNNIVTVRRLILHLAVPQGDQPQEVQVDQLAQAGLLWAQGEM